MATRSCSSSATEAVPAKPVVAAPELRPSSSSVEPATSAGREERLFSLIELELRAHQPAVLKSYVWMVETMARELEVTLAFSEAEEEPHKTRKTLLKSAFVHSKHRVQYELRTHYWELKFKNVTESTRDTFLEYIQRNLPEGVAMKVTEHELKRLPPNILKTMAKQA